MWSRSARDLFLNIMHENKCKVASNNYDVMFWAEHRPIAEMVLGMVHRAIIEETLRNLGEDTALAMGEFLSAKEKQLMGQVLWPLVGT